MTEDKLALARKFMETWNKQAGRNMITLGETTQTPLIPTGLRALDHILGGGLPMGRIAVLWGEENVGKNTLMYKMMTEYQKRFPEKLAAYMPLEGHLFYNYMSKIGVDTAELLKLDPVTGEDVFALAKDLSERQIASFIGIDSLASLLPKAEDSQNEKDFVGLQPRLLSQKLRETNPYFIQNNVTVVFTNQMREKIVMIGNPQTMPGGHAIRHYNRTTIFLMRDASVNDIYDDITAQQRNASDGYAATGHKVKMRLMKTSHMGTQPHAQCLAVLKYDGSGYDDIFDLDYVARRLGVLQVAGASYRIVNTETGEVVEQARGKEKYYDRLRTEDNFYKLVDALTATAMSKCVRSVDEISEEDPEDDLVEEEEPVDSVESESADA
jgi:protein RecA